MYLSVQEMAEYLNLPASYLEQLIQEKKIRAVFDGEQYLINRDQFSNYHEQLEVYKKLFQEWLHEPIPEDWDAKDEDWPNKREAPI